MAGRGAGGTGAMGWGQERRSRLFMSVRAGKRLAGSRTASSATKTTASVACARSKFRGPVREFVPLRSESA